MLLVSLIADFLVGCLPNCLFSCWTVVHDDEGGAVGNGSNDDYVDDGDDVDFRTET